MSVRGWIQTGLVCLKERHSTFDSILGQAEASEGGRHKTLLGQAASEGSREKTPPAAWVLVPPFKADNANMTSSFVALLVHSVLYHCQVSGDGLRGSLL